jgi:hypothetical protein
MRPLEDVAAVLELSAQGFGASAIARRTGIPRGTVRDWVTGRVPKRGSNDGESCEACGGVAHRFGDLPPEYVYLLGLYLGDGCISAYRRGVYKLRINLDLRYPGIIDYSFSNRSDDILATFRDACDHLGLHWTNAGHTVYVSRVTDVAVLDGFIGPKA